MTRDSTLQPALRRTEATMSAILSIGCDRETAANYTNCSLSDIRREMLRDVAFAAEVLQAEAASELAHMRNVQNAAGENKNWRASVWWLERRSPERFGRRNAETITTRQLKALSHNWRHRAGNGAGSHRPQRLLMRLDQVEKIVAGNISRQRFTSCAVVRQSPPILGGSEMRRPPDIQIDRQGFRRRIQRMTEFTPSNDLIDESRQRRPATCSACAGCCAAICPTRPRG